MNRLTTRLFRFDEYPGPRHKLKLAVRDHRFARVQPFGYYSLPIQHLTRDDRSGLDTAVGFHHENELSGLPRLDCLRENNHGIGDTGQGKRHIDELARPETSVLVGECSLDLYRACGGIDDIIQETQGSLLV